MCYGDVALEGEQTTFPEGFNGSDGWDAKHVCKDYSQVYDYLESNRVNNKLWIWDVFRCVGMGPILLKTMLFQCQKQHRNWVGISLV